MENYKQCTICGYLSEPNDLIDECPNCSGKTYSQHINGDPVNHPSHYTSSIPGIEVIDITKHLNFCCGNVVKYVLRAGLKGDKSKHIEDLEKAKKYIDFEIERLNNESIL